MILTICSILLAISAILTLHRLLRGPTPADRVLAIDLLGIIAGAAFVLIAIEYDQPVFVDVVVVLGVIIFFGTVAISRALARDGRRSPLDSESDTLS